MKRINYLLSAFVILSTCFSITYAQQDESKLSIDRIFASRDFRGERFGPARWIEKGEKYTTLENSATQDGSDDIIAYSTKSGTRSVLISADRLIPADSDKPLSVQDYEWSNDGKRMLIYTNSKRVWRRNTRGDYWVLDLATWKLQQLGKKFPESSLMFAKFSPDGKSVGYVSGHNLYVEDIDAGNITTLTTDGTEDLINGTFDWAYEEEFDCRDGFRWSPDGKFIAYWQVDASKIRDFLMLNTTDSLYPFTVPVQYPKVGQDPSKVRIGYVSATGGATYWLPIPGDPVQNYLPRMMWSVDSKQIFVQQIPRKQDTNHIWAYTLGESEAKNIYTDHDDAWVDVVDDWIWLNHGKEFSWVSEKDGWRHFYKISRDGLSAKLVTKGNYDMINIEDIDDEGGYVYFIASPENPTQRYLYRTKLDGNGKLERLTPSNETGTHSYQVSPGGKYGFHTYSDADTPPTIDLVSLPEHKVVRVLVDNKELKSAVDKLDRSKTEFFRVTTEDGIVMDGMMIRPPDFDPAKKYPVLFYVYGEPAGQTARDVWSGSRMLWHTLLAQQGYIVITMDNRGSPSPRGREWRKSLFRKIGVINIRDQAMGAKEVLKWDFVDPDRTAVWGWSGGGSSTLNLLFQYPDIYKAGMSVAPVANQLLYDNIYQERYMGVPWETKEDYVAGSPITHAAGLKGDLLLVHGTGDDNVHYQNSEQMINALIKNNKLFQLMSYPNRSHGIFEGYNTTRHVYETLTHFLNEHVEPGGKPILKINSK